MTIIITRTGKGSPIAQAENDSNLNSLCNINEPQAGATYTISADDQNDVIEFSNVSAITATLTLISTILSGVDTSDFKVMIKNVGVGVVTITPTVNTFDDGDAIKVLSQYEWMTIQTDSTETKWNIIESSNSIKVGGFNANQFLRSDVNDSAAGDLTFNGENSFTDINTFSGVSVFFNGTNVDFSSVNTYSGSNTFSGTHVEFSGVNVDFSGVNVNFNVTNLRLNGTIVTATGIELNYLSGATNGVVLTTGDEGSGQGLDADTVDTYHATALLARANHTGTQALSTITGVTATATEVNLLDGATATDISGSGLLAGVINAIYPVGSIYTSILATNPGTFLGIGTWATYGAGRTVVGEGGAFSGTGGSADAIVVGHSHGSGTYTADSSGAHTHDVAGYVDGGSITAIHTTTSGNTLSTVSGAALSSGAHTHSISGTSASIGSGATNANMPPYITTYIWRRTA